MYYNNEILSKSKDPKALYTTLSTLLGKSSDVVLPQIKDIDDVGLANEFSEFFSNKIFKIRNDISTITTSKGTGQDKYFSGRKLDHFKPFSEAEMLILLKESKPTWCLLDPFPTKILLQCADTLVPVITKVINSSLQSGIVPHPFKVAVIKPLIKKPSLDKNIFKNYRPVSNLPFLSKVLEKAVKKRLLEHLIENNLLHKFQSAYRQSHGTETALNRVLNDINLMVDEGNLGLLVLLDLSAAFDTIDHQILLDRLQTSFGLDGCVLSWFVSYLTGRRQFISVRNSYSTEVLLPCGVPQGSVLGPILFTLYTSELGSLINTHNDVNHTSMPMTHN
ncbi:hypothetical protein SNE40_004070 [Patella caerulea]|uniref:Reverse transcriptase domain-containing protein n=1 Tax=Patella caerulea TaxID=87958 RepID=A0AAN8KFF1_PATCE